MTKEQFSAAVFGSLFAGMIFSGFVTLILRIFIDGVSDDDWVFWYWVIVAVFFFLSQPLALKAAAQLSVMLGVIWGLISALDWVAAMGG